MFVESNKVLTSIKCNSSIYYECQWRSKLSLVSRSFLNIYLSFSGCREVWPDQAYFSVSFINWFWSSADVQIMVWMCRCDISLLCASTEVGQRFCFIAILGVERVFWQNIVNHGVWVTWVTEFDFIKSSSTSRISVCPLSIVIQNLFCTKTDIQNLFWIFTLSCRRVPVTHSNTSYLYRPPRSSLTKWSPD